MPHGFPSSCFLFQHILRRKGAREGGFAGIFGVCMRDVLHPGALPLCCLGSREDLNFPNSLPPRVFTQLTVHVGVDPAVKAIFLEQRGKNRGYRDADIRGFRPERGVCLPDGPEVIVSRVDMKAVSRRVAVEGVAVAFSGDAGRCVASLGK